MKNIMQKSIFNYLAVLVLILGLSSCDKDETDNISRITYYANITVQGESYMVIQQGTTFDDPGATAEADGKSLDVKVSGTVDTSTPGVYMLTYSATNKDGYDASKSRTVLVTSEDISNVDLSGSYQGAGFGSDVVTVTKEAEGKYYCNKALASGNNLGVTFYHLGGNALVIPDQASPFGNVNTTSAGASAMLTPGGFQWTIFVGCCGNFGPITFTKL